MMARIIIAAILLVVVYSMPDPPNFPVKEICEAYKEKCLNKFNRNDCDDRSIECEKYAHQGIQTAWSFCMFSNNYDLAACNERIQVDFQIIKKWISLDDFKYLPQ